MTEFKFEDLSKKTVAQLRKIAEGMEHEALQDPAKMPKEELLAALCQALGIEAGESPEKTALGKEPAAQEDAASESAPEGAEEEEPAAKTSAKKKKAPAQESTPTESPAVVNKEKSKLKVQIRELKSQRNAALVAHDHVQLKSIRRRIRTLKRKVRRIAV